LSEPKKLSASLDLVNPFDAWSDEDWAKHEARLAAVKPAVDTFVPSNWANSKSRSRSLADMGWPARALDEADNADTSKTAITRLSTWNLDERNVVVLSGPPGTGKTVGAAHWCLGRRERIEFVRASTFASSSRYDQTARARWYDAAGLCLDDLGAEYLDSKGSFLVDLDELVDTYYADKRPLIITTNLDGNEFKRRYGRRVEDRIRECALWVVVAGDSLRRSP
jgi:hypothetical protein